MKVARRRLSVANGRFIAARALFFDRVGGGLLGSPNFGAISQNSSQTLQSWQSFAAPII